MSSSDSSFSTAVVSNPKTSEALRAALAREELTLLLGLLLDLLSSTASSGSSAASGGGSGAATRADRREKVLHILALKSLQCKTSQSVNLFVSIPVVGS